MANADENCVGKDGTVYQLNEMFKVVRDLLQDEELDEDQLRIFMRSQMFSELCPDLHEAFNSSEAIIKSEQKKEASGSAEVAETSKQKKDPQETKPKSQESASALKNQPVKIKTRVISITSSSSSSSSSGSDLDKPPPKPLPGESEKKKKLIKKKAIKLSRSSDSSSESLLSIGGNKPVKHKPTKPIRRDSKLDKVKDKQQKSHEDKEKDAPKVHPFYLGMMGNIIEPKGKLFEPDGLKPEPEVRKRKHEEEKKPKKKPEVRLPKPYSYYDKSTSKIRKGKSWKPYADRDFKRMERRHKLRTMSVVCVDLLNMDTFFNNPHSSTAPCATSIPLKRNMHISDEKGDMIERFEKLKADAFKPRLTKMYQKSLVSRVSRDSSGDARRDKKHNQRRAISSSSDSSSDPMVPKKGMASYSRDRGSSSKHDKSNARKGTAEWKAEQRKKQLHTIKPKVGNTRKLPWESNEYFENKKKEIKKDEHMTAKEREKKRLQDKLKLSKPNAPAVSFQKILNQIAAENKEAAKKPVVALKIPKLSEKVINNEYKKPDRPISVGDVAHEVARMLSSNSKIEIPVMPSNTVDLAEYTIRKLAWWFLKSEKEPADEVLVHPELHDDEIMEPWYTPNFGSESDDSSIGCVSDPEGITKNQDSKLMRNVDSDVADEFCGLQSLESKIRVPKDKDGNLREGVYKSFFKVRPGTNYEKGNFETKCFLCEEKIIGQRRLGAHIRSASHRNNFKNISLQLANYEESCVPVVTKKMYLARLVEYTVDSQPVCVEVKDKTSRVSEDANTSTAIAKQQRSAEKVGVDDLPVDQLSLPSVTMYDIKTDDALVQLKSTLKNAGLWTEEMQGRWEQMEDEEYRMIKEYDDIRDQYINAPNTHPRHNEEWKEFWDRRYLELENEGKDPDSYNFSDEWVPYWLKKMQELMKTQSDHEIMEMKRSLRMDRDSLNLLLAKNGLKKTLKDQPSKKTPSAGSSLLQKMPAVKKGAQQVTEVVPEIPKFKAQHSRELGLISTFKAEHRKELGLISTFKAEHIRELGLYEDHVNKKTSVPGSPTPWVKKEIVDQQQSFIKKEDHPILTSKYDKSPGILPNYLSPQQTNPTKNNSPITIGIKKEPIVSHHLHQKPAAHVPDSTAKSNNRQMDGEKIASILSGMPAATGKRTPAAPPPPKISMKKSEELPDLGKAIPSRSRAWDVSSGSDWEPSAKKSKVVDSITNDCSKNSNHRSLAESWSDIPLSFGSAGLGKDRNENTQNGSKALSSNGKPKDLNTALEELREAVENAEPILESIDLLTDVPKDTESVSGASGEMDKVSLDTSVIMEDAENVNKDSVVKGSKITSRSESTIAKEECNLAPPILPNGHSTPEEGEIGSSGSSVSLGIDANHVSSFIDDFNPNGVSRPRKKRRKRKSKNKDNKSQHRPDIPAKTFSYPSPTSLSLNPNSIGYHLLAKQKSSEVEDKRKYEENEPRKLSVDERYEFTRKKGTTNPPSKAYSTAPIDPTGYSQYRPNYASYDANYDGYSKNPWNPR